MNPHDNNYMRPAQEAHECEHCGREHYEDGYYCSEECAKADLI